MIMNAIAITFLSLATITTSEVLGDGYDEKREPWRTMKSEVKFLKEHVKVLGFNASEQVEISNYGETDEVLAVKLLIELKNFTQDLANRDSEAFATFAEQIHQELTSVFGSGFPNNENFNGAYTIRWIENYEEKALVFMLFKPIGTSVPDVAVQLLQDSIVAKHLGVLDVRNGTAQVLKPVERETVYEIFLQLYEVKYLPGMDVKESITFQNMTDQMLHLVGTRFRNRFGEHFYRMVVTNFYPSFQSLIVRAFVLLDPNSENLYYATTIWFSIEGYIYLGKFPLLPGNVEVIESREVPKDFHNYLDDRSYRRPFDEEFRTHPAISVTLPAALGLAFGILVVMALLKLCHYVAYSEDEKIKEKEKVLRSGGYKN